MQTNQIPISSLSKSNFQISKLGLGCAGLGNLYSAISNEQALNTIAKGYELGISYFDTAPWYGTGLSEHRLGLGTHSFDRSTYQISTKVGRFLVPDPNYKNHQQFQKFWPERMPFDVKFDYTYDAIMKQHQDSLQRLGKFHVELLIIHDLEPAQLGNDFEKHYQELFGAGNGIKALHDLKQQGLISAFGAGINGNLEKSFQERYVADLIKNQADFLMYAGSPTLLDQNAMDIPNIQDIDIILAAPYCSGILAQSSTKFYYHSAPQDIINKVEQMKQICDNFKVPLKAAALHYPFQFKNVKSVIPGAKSPQEVQENCEMIKINIPDEFWLEMRKQGLIR